MPRTMPETRATTYWDYIRVADLTSLQDGLERDESKLSNDEVLFITVHQVYELWFKLILRELRSMRNFFGAESVDDPEVSKAVRSLRRVTTILRCCVDHWPVVETLTTRDFLEFRDKLFPASGFQSYQLRQIEILLGITDADRAELQSELDYEKFLREPDGSESIASKRVDEQTHRPTLKNVVEEWLWRTPIDGKGPEDEGADEALDEFLNEFIECHRRELERSRDMAFERMHVAIDRDDLAKKYAKDADRVRAFFFGEDVELRRRRIRAAMLFIHTYRTLPLLAWPRDVLDLLIEVEQTLIVFRQRHARMVERVIGRRTGTGGSSGVQYLDDTALKFRIFEDLWKIRTLQVRQSASPELKHADFYSFRYSRG